MVDFQAPSDNTLPLVGQKNRSEFQTGNSDPPLLPPPVPIQTKTRFKYCPIIGMPPANVPRVTRKSPNRTNRPYNSTQKPVRGQRKRIRKIPRAKVKVPVSFCRRAKKVRVFAGPRIRGSPIKKRIWTESEDQKVHMEKKKGRGQRNATFPIASLGRES